MMSSLKLCKPLLAGLLLAAGSFPGYAQTAAANVSASQRTIRLNVVAVDSAGKPVPDLTASQIAVSDNGSPQQVVSLRLNQSDTPGPLVILFDLMNSGQDSRGAVWNAMKSSLDRLPSAGPVYLYLLVEDGSLYPVHAVPGAPAAGVDADASWAKDIRPLLDAAMQKVTEARPLEFRATSPTSAQERFKATYRSLDDMRARMANLRGPKELLWVTYGILSTIRLVDRTWFDGVPLLRQIGARFVQSEITAYTADPGIGVQAGLLNRDSLDILTGATGGRNVLDDCAQPRDRPDRIRCAHQLRGGISAAGWELGRQVPQAASDGGPQGSARAERARLLRRFGVVTSAQVGETIVFRGLSARPRPHRSNCRAPPVVISLLCRHVS
jgi:hypothetical protein